MVTNKSWLRSSRANRSLASAKSAVSDVASCMLDIIEIEELPAADSEPMQIVHEANDICNRIDALQRRVSKLYDAQYASLTNF